MYRLPDGDRGGHDGRGRRRPGPEPKCRPHEPRNGHEDQRGRGRLTGKPSGGPDAARGQERHEQQPDLDGPAGPPLGQRLAPPCQEQRRHEEYPGRVSKPPREPHRSVHGQGRDTGQRDTGRADAGRHRGCDERHGRKREHVPRSVERIADAHQSAKQKCTHHGFCRVAETDRRRDDDDRERAGGLIREEGHHVREQCPHHDPRPHLVPEKEDRRQGDPGGGPDG